MPDRLIAKFEKNAAEEVQVALTEYKGHNLCSLRVYCDARNSTERIPTKKGIAVRVDLLPDLVEAVRQAEAEARASGLLGEGDEPAYEGQITDSDPSTATPPGRERNGVSQ